MDNQAGNVLALAMRICACVCGGGGGGGAVRVSFKCSQFATRYIYV